MIPRTNHRVPVGYPASITCDAGSGEATLLDLSPTGCKLRSDVRLNAGSYVALQIDLAHEPHPLGVEVSVVRWCKDGQLGIEFLRYGHGERERVTSLVGTFPAHPHSAQSPILDSALSSVSA